MLNYIYSFFNSQSTNNIVNNSNSQYSINTKDIKDVDNNESIKGVLVANDNKQSISSTNLSIKNINSNENSNNIKINQQSDNIIEKLYSKNIQDSNRVDNNYYTKNYHEYTLKNRQGYNYTYNPINSTDKTYDIIEKLHNNTLKQRQGYNYTNYNINKN